MEEKKIKSIKRRVFEIIQIGNKSDITSRLFDIAIVLVILLNIAAMFLETFTELVAYKPIFTMIENVTVIVFIIEYVLRIWTADLLFPEDKTPTAVFKFLISFDGIVDLLTILPFFYLTGFVAFRMLRVVRILHLFRINNRYDSFSVIKDVLKDKSSQILSSSFICITLMLAASLGMYSAEHAAQPEVFKNAFSGIWWAVSTMLTIGYGDIYPVTILGQIMAILTAFLGVGVVAIPTGIISAGFVEQYTRVKDTDFFSNEDGLHFVNITIDNNHNWLNQKVADVAVPQGLVMVLILRDGQSYVPNGDTTLLLNDVVVFAAESYVDDIGISFTSILVGDKHKWAREYVKNLDISRLTTLVAIERGHKIVIPHGETLILPGDKVLIYSKKKGSLY